MFLELRHEQGHGAHWEARPGRGNRKTKGGAAKNLTHGWDRDDNGTAPAYVRPHCSASVDVIKCCPSTEAAPGTICRRRSCGLRYRYAIYYLSVALSDAQLSHYFSRTHARRLGSIRM